MIYRCNKHACIPERCCKKLLPSPTHIQPFPPVTNFCAFACNTEQTALALVNAGTDIPLPNNQYIPNGFFITDQTQLEVVNAGVYAIQYAINLTEPILVGSRVMLDGNPISQSILGPVVENSFSTQFIMILPENSTLSLQLFGFNGASTLRLGVGAYLSVIRLQ